MDLSTYIKLNFVEKYAVDLGQKPVNFGHYNWIQQEKLFYKTMFGKCEKLLNLVGVANCDRQPLIFSLLFTHRTMLLQI